MSTKRLKTGNLKVVCGRLYGTVSRGATKAFFLVNFSEFCFVLLYCCYILSNTWCGDYACSL